MGPFKLRKIRVEGDIAYVPLTKGFEAIIDAADAASVGAFNWHVLITKNGIYAHRKAMVIDGIFGKIYLHRQIMASPEACIDHISGNGLDNRRANLRAASYSENSRNTGRPKNNSSGFKGVSWDAGRKQFRAQIVVNRKRIHLGWGHDPALVHKMYIDALQKYHGDFGRTE